MLGPFTEYPDQFSEFTEGLKVKSEEASSAKCAGKESAFESGGIEFSSTEGAHEPVWSKGSLHDAGVSALAGKL